MALAGGGSVKAISIDGRNFAVAADADAILKLGGPTVLSNGNGTVRYLMEIVPWQVQGLDVAIDHAIDDLGFLQRNADEMKSVNCTVMLVDDTTLQGKGIVVSLECGTAKATASLTLMGEGDLISQ